MSLAAGKKQGQIPVQVHKWAERPRHRGPRGGQGREHPEGSQKQKLTSPIAFSYGT